MKWLKRLQKKEDGVALLIVLGFLAIGSLTIVSLINLTDTGMIAGKTYDEKVRLEYAADAGLEEALWRMKAEGLPFTPGTYGESFSYNVTESINGKIVTVNMTYIWPLTGLVEADNTTDPEELKITGGIINKNTGKYKIQISYDEDAGSIHASNVSVWLPSRFEYVEGSSEGFTTDDPSSETYQRGGKVFTWDLANETFDDLYTPPDGSGGFTPGTEYPMSIKLYFNVTPTDDVGGGSICWVETTDTDTPLAWETGCDLYQLEAIATDNISGKSYSLSSSTYFSEGSSLGEGVYQMKGDYRAIGNTLMTDKQADNIRYLLIESSSANVTDIPADGEVVLGYLYWTGWVQNTSQIDTDVLFSINGQGVYFDEYGLAANGTANLSASKHSYVHTALGGYHYSCFKDVTDLVQINNPQGNGEYTVENVTAVTGNHESFAGWSLVLFYSSPTEDPHQMFIYDQLLYASSGSHPFEIEGFESPENAEAKLTVFVGEGDAQFGNDVNEADDPPGEYKWGWNPFPNWEYYWKWDGAVDYILFEDTYLTDNLTPHINPPFNVWNGMSSGLDGLFIDGVDIDTFDVSEPIIDPGMQSATVTIGTTQDAFCMIYIVLSFSSEHGGLTPNASGIISYSGGY